MLNFTERLAREVSRAARMSLPELEQAMAEEGESSVCRRTALSLAKRAAEGGLDAVKMIRELSRSEPEGPKEAPVVEIRVVS